MPGTAPHPRSRIHMRLFTLTAIVVLTFAISCADERVVVEPRASPPETSATATPSSAPASATEAATPASTTSPAPTQTPRGRPSPAAPVRLVVATVLSVTDGDTIRVLIDGREEPLRLIGINAPEQTECYAPEATDKLTELVNGREVTLVQDASDRDQFGRLLRYVYLDDVFVNDVLVREGYVISHRYEPDTAMAETLEASGASARAEGRGLWAVDACGPAAQALVEIVTVQYDAPGNDNQNLNGEWVEFRNRGLASLDLTGWAIKDESASHRFAFPNGFTLAPGAIVRLYTGCGPATPGELYWCNSGSAVWNNSGDTVFVLDPAGNIAALRSYK